MSAPADFWSRRRAQVAREEAQDRLEQVEHARAAQEREEAQLSDDALCAKYELPALDEIVDPEQIKAFLQNGVPQRLKTLALRRLWRLNPVLANVDGLVDYGDDFANPPLIGEAVKTAYQVGKGMLKHIEALAEEEAARVKAMDAPQDEPDLPQADAPMIEDPADEARQDAITLEVSKPVATEPTHEDIDQDHVPPRRRRMVFNVTQEGA